MFQVGGIKECAVFGGWGRKLSLDGDSWSLYERARQSKTLSDTFAENIRKIEFNDQMNMTDDRSITGKILHL